MIYIPLYRVRDALAAHYKEFQTYCSISSVCQKLRHHPEYFIEDYYNPFPEQIDLMSDDEFIECFVHSPFPLEQAINAFEKPNDFSSLAESIFSKQVLFHIFLQENFDKQNRHQHDYFEITYVFKGQCTIEFEHSSVQMSEGNVCIVAPNTPHEAFVLDPDSFVINLSMTTEAFQSAISTVLLRRDLVASYIQTILFQKDMPNYLLIPSNNSEGIKSTIKHIARENRNTELHSFSICISWFSVFMCSVLENYRSDVQIYHNDNHSAFADHLTLLEYIQNNFRTITLDSLASTFNYNKSYLSRLILQLTGRSFIDIVTHMKLQAGCDFLKNTDFSLDQIAEAVGYNTGDYFSKAFKRVYHMSPSKYRSENKRVSTPGSQHVPSVAFPL